jgi:hypothetical protein
MKKKIKKNYINSKDFNKLVKEDQLKGEMSMRLKEEIWKIIEGVSQRNNFRGYDIDHRKNMELLGFEHIMRYWKNCDVEKGNAFSYYNQTIFNAFRQTINKKKPEYDYLNNEQDQIKSIIESSSTEVNLKEIETQLNQDFLGQENSYQIKIKKREEDVIYDRNIEIDILFENSETKDDLLTLTERYNREGKKNIKIIKKSKTLLKILMDYQEEINK